MPHEPRKLAASAPIVDRRRGRRAFTLVEMLIAMAIIVILLSLLIVGLNSATRSAQVGKTRVLMQSMKQAIVRFKEDHGYLPPVLSNDDDRRLLEGPLPSSGSYEAEVRTWYSATSLAEYLIGYAENRFDGYGSVNLGETPFAGIRSPGPDGVWGAGPGVAKERRDPVTTGKVFGPYIEVEDDRLIGALVGQPNPLQFTVRFPGEAGYDLARSKTIVDHWGSPIVYVRRNYPPQSLGQSYRSVDYDGDGVPDPVPTLSDVPYLRPYEVVEGAGSTARFPDAANDLSTSLSLDTAEFALISPGPDKAIDVDERRDADELNKDNIVEIGP